VRVLLTVVLFALASGGARAADDRPSLKEVLRRAGEYVARYHEAVASVVAEERYVQTWSSQSPGASRTRGASAFTERRALLSDFILIGGGGRSEPRWLTYRDVLEVDGTAVRTSDGRLQRILSSSGNGLDAAQAVAAESTRYNIGPAGFVRTINTPIVAMDFLLPDTVRRFSFHRRNGRDTPDAGLWDIAYEERERPTVIRTPEGKSVPASGIFRIEPATGRIVESTLHVGEPNATVAVAFAVDARLQIAVPVSMTEEYLLGEDRVDGQAAYSNYRRFETDARILLRR